MRDRPIPPKIDSETCNECGLCVRDCPTMTLELEGGKPGLARPEWCMSCGHCGAICPTGAIVHESTAVAEDVEGPDRQPAVSAEELLALIRERRSVRAYKKKPVPREVIQQILEVGRYVPTGTHSENVRYMVLDTPERIGELRDRVVSFYGKLFGRVRNPIGSLLVRLVAGKKTHEVLQGYLPIVEEAKERIDRGEDRLMFDPPVVVIAHAEKWDTCSAFNCSAALFSCSLMAHSLGLGCCFNGFIEGAINNGKSIANWLGLPKDHKCYMAMTMGYQKPKYQRLVARAPVQVEWK